MRIYRHCCGIHTLPASGLAAVYICMLVPYCLWQAYALGAFPYLCAP